MNKKLVLEKTEVLQKFKEKKYVLLRADWTHQDDQITQVLKRYGRSGVPVYVIYSGEGSPKLLSEILTVPMILKALK